MYLIEEKQITGESINIGSMLLKITAALISGILLLK